MNYNKENNAEVHCRDFIYYNNVHCKTLISQTLKGTSRARLIHSPKNVSPRIVKCIIRHSLVPDGGPVCVMLSPKFECFSE